MLIDLRSQWEADDPSVTSGAIAQLAQSFRNVRTNSLYAWEDENLLAGYSQEYYGAISQLANSFRNVRNCSLYAENDENLLAGYFPVDLLRWTSPADRMRQGFGPRIDTNTDNAWLENLVPIIGWNAPSDRMARASGRWTPETNPDNAWIYSVQPVIEPFDPALFPAIAELVGIRTPAAASLAVAYYLAIYDLGWVHDVIPLTDPVPGAEIIHLRPIAPVMSARRRNKRRR